MLFLSSTFLVCLYPEAVLSLYSESAMEVLLSQFFVHLCLCALCTCFRSQDRETRSWSRKIGRCAEQKSGVFVIVPQTVREIVGADLISHCGASWNSQLVAPHWRSCSNTIAWKANRHNLISVVSRKKNFVSVWARPLFDWRKLFNDPISPPRFYGGRVFELGWRMFDFQVRFSQDCRQHRDAWSCTSPKANVIFRNTPSDKGHLLKFAIEFFWTGCQWRLNVLPIAVSTCHAIRSPTQVRLTDTGSITAGAGYLPTVGSQTSDSDAVGNETIDCDLVEMPAMFSSDDACGTNCMTQVWLGDASGWINIVDYHRSCRKVSRVACEIFLMSFNHLLDEPKPKGMMNMHLLLYLAIWTVRCACKTMNLLHLKARLNQVLPACLLSFTPTFCLSSPFPFYTPSHISLSLFPLLSLSLSLSLSFSRSMSPLPFLSLLLSFSLYFYFLSIQRWRVCNSRIMDLLTVNHLTWVASERDGLFLYHSGKKSFIDQWNGRGLNYPPSPERSRAHTHTVSSPSLIPPRQAFFGNPPTVGSPISTSWGVVNSRGSDENEDGMIFPFRIVSLVAVPSLKYVLVNHTDGSLAVFSDSLHGSTGDFKPLANHDPVKGHEVCCMAHVQRCGSPDELWLGLFSGEVAVVSCEELRKPGLLQNLPSRAHMWVTLCLVWNEPLRSQIPAAEIVSEIVCLLHYITMWQFRCSYCFNKRGSKTKGNMHNYNDNSMVCPANTIGSRLQGD